MQSSPPTSDGKARTLRELSRSLSHSPRNIPSPSPPPSDSNPTKHSGFETETSVFFDDPDVIMSTQHKIDDDTNTLPQYPRIRSTAKKINAWHMLRSEQPVPDTSMVNKEFGDFDHSLSGEDDISVEQARGGNRSSYSTPHKFSSQFNSLYDITPPSNRTRKPYAETGSLRRDAQIRRASRNDLDTASPRPTSKRNSPAVPEYQERRHTSLAQLHAKLSEDESSFMDQRPPTLTIDSTKNTRWGNRTRQASGQHDQTVDSLYRVKTKSHSRPGTSHNATAQSFILPDLPNLTELVSGVFEDGTPIFSKTAPARSRFSAPPGGSHRPQHIPIDGVPIPEEEKMIFAALQQLQDKVAQMEQERAEAVRKIEEQDFELIELRATNQAQDKLRRSDSALDSDSGKGSWKIEKTRLDATVQTLRTKLDRVERKTAVLEIEKKRLNTERDNMASQLSVAFQTCEELKSEKNALSDEVNALRVELEDLRVENEKLRSKLEQERSQHQEATVQLQRQFDHAASATERENVTLHAELAHVRAQHDGHTQQLARMDSELRKALQEQADHDRLKNDHESLQSQLAKLKAKREDDIKRWSRQEAALMAQVDSRDETIRRFQDLTQEETNEAVRLDNENLRSELAELLRQHEDEHEHWAKKEAEMKRMIRQREDAARANLDMTREVLGARRATDQQSKVSTSESKGKGKAEDVALQRKPSFRRDNTRTRIQTRIQQELHDSRAVSTPHLTSRRAESSVPPGTYRRVSAPSTAAKIAQVESDVESTTDLSLAPHGTPYSSRSNASNKASSTIAPPVDLELTELSFIDSAQIAQLRRALEEERAATRRRAAAPPFESGQCDGTVHNQRQGREDTVRSIVSVRSEGRLPPPRKSSLKDITQRTNITRFEEDATGNMSNPDADPESTQTRQTAVDDSRLSNTGRRRRSAPTEMTSAFILPDIKFDNRKQTTTTITISQKAVGKDHDNRNCTVCRRESLATTTEDLRVPKLVPVSSRMPDDADATLRPSRSPREALALVVKELKDERAHLHMELAVMRAMLESHDVSLGNRKRRELNASIRDILHRLEIKDTQIYNLYDVLEGQQSEELTEMDVENITEQIRGEEEKAEEEPEKKAKKVTIRSFIDDDSIELGRGANGNTDEETEELPWEGFEDSGLDGDTNYGNWRINVH